MATWEEALAQATSDPAAGCRHDAIIEQYGEVAAKIFNHTDPTGYAVSEHGRDWRNHRAQLALVDEATLQDPLGRGKLDISQGWLKSDLQSNRTGQNVEKRNFDAEQLDPRSKGFDPELFLLQFHSDIDAAYLFEDGRAALQKDRSFHMTSTSELVKSHFDKLILVDDAVESFRSVIVGTKTNSLLLKNTNSTASNANALEKAFQETESLTSQVYGPLLDRRVDTDRIQRVLTTMQKFKYVYELPAKLREAIALGESTASEGHISDSSNAVDDSQQHRAVGRVISIAAGSLQASASSIVADYKKTKKWIEAQPESPALQRIVSEINIATIDFRTAIYRRMEDPMMSSEALEQNLRVLATLDPKEDHAMRILTRRQEKALEGLRRVRGAGAADFIMRQRLGDATNDRHEYAEVMLSAEKLTVKLCNALGDGISLFWRLAQVVSRGSTEWIDTKSANGIHLLISEIVGEYAEGVRMTILPQQLTGVGLVSRQAATEVISVLRYTQSLGVPASHLGSLRSITDEVSESFLANAVRSMRNVAQELASEPQTDANTLPEQILLLVRETLASIDGVYQRNSSAAESARNACVKAPVLAAQALRSSVMGDADDDESMGLIYRAPSSSGCINIYGDSLSTEESSRLLIMGAICSKLRVEVIPSIGQSVSEVFGGDDLARIVTSAVGAIHRIESSATELFAHFLAMPLVGRVVRGVVCGGSMNPTSLLSEPRQYAMALVMELALISSACRNAVGAGNEIAYRAVDLLVGSVAAAFRSGIRELEGIHPRLGEQILLEVEFVDSVLSGGRSAHPTISTGGAAGGSRRTAEKHSPFAIPKRQLRDDIVKKHDETRFAELLNAAVERAQFLCGAFISENGPRKAPTRRIGLLGDTGHRHLIN